MLFATYKFFSAALGREVNTRVILPSREEKDPFEKESFRPYQEEPLKVLYLLHGGFGCEEDWLYMTRLASLVRKGRAMIVMPFAENSYYQDLPYGPGYWTFISEELPEMILPMFPQASRKREDTFAAGLSMGGYGALRLGLAKPERFAAVASLSGVLDLKARIADSKGSLASRGLRFSDNFFDEDEIGDSDLLVLMKKAAEQKEKLPRFYFSVGTEDFVYPYNQNAKKQMDACGIPYHYEEHPGAHEWSYWNLYIESVLKWMKLIP